MDLSLTYEKLLDFPEDFMKKSVKYSVIADPISSEECKKYNTKDLHDKVSFRIRKFKDAKYIYQFPDLKYNIPMTPNYQLREVIMPRNLESSQSKIITKETAKLKYKLANILLAIIYFAVSLSKLPNNSSSRLQKNSKENRSTSSYTNIDVFISNYLKFITLIANNTMLFLIN